jgi:4-amino-4-deoxy-L-arabinose transferase-like glycosyltransferase
VRREKLIVLACVVCYLLLAVLLANVRAPQSDEGHFAEGAVNLAFHGHLALPTWTPWISTLDQKVYAVMPLYFFGLGAWFRIFGVGMLTMRYFSVLWGGILVVSYFLLLRQTSKDLVLGILGLFVLAFSYDVVNLTTARYDAMAAGLAALGLGFYAVLRRHHLGVAILVANACMARLRFCLLPYFLPVGMTHGRGGSPSIARSPTPSAPAPTAAPSAFTTSNACWFRSCSTRSSPCSCWALSSSATAWNASSASRWSPC